MGRSLKYAIHFRKCKTITKIKLKFKNLKMNTEISPAKKVEEKIAKKESLSLARQNCDFC